MKHDLKFHCATLSQGRYEFCEQSLPAGAPSVWENWELADMSSEFSPAQRQHGQLGMSNIPYIRRGGREGEREGAALKLHSLMPSVSGA